MKRRDFLFGLLAGASTAVSGTKLAQNIARKNEMANAKSDVYRFSTPSFAQQGEDLILQNIFRYLEIPEPSYIDIGAFDPIVSNNTFAFYLSGSRGVLVEPNPTYYERLKDVRNEDVALNIGIGITDQKEAPYYVIRGYSQLNTFSEEQVERYKEMFGADAVEKVIPMPLVNINTILEEHLPSGPNLFSIDVEGLDLAILNTLDFDRFRPEVFCIETLVVGSKIVNVELVDFMLERGYSIRGGTFVNTIFVDDQALMSVPPRES